MKSIEIDFEVWKEIVAQQKNENDSPNHVLRRQFKLSTASAASKAVVTYWSSRGGQIPVGTKLRARYKGKVYEALVTLKGIELGGKRYSDVSNAASEIAGGARNGWNFFEAQTPGETKWRPLSALRSR